MTLGEAKPWVEYQKRQLLFREAVIAFLTGNSESEPEYCKSCRAAGLDDCKNCDKQFQPVE